MKAACSSQPDLPLERPDASHRGPDRVSVTRKNAIVAVRATDQAGAVGALDRLGAVARAELAVEAAGVLVDRVR